MLPRCFKNCDIYLCNFEFQFPTLPTQLPTHCTYLFIHPSYLPTYLPIYPPHLFIYLPTHLIYRFTYQLSTHLTYQLNYQHVHPTYLLIHPSSYLLSICTLSLLIDEIIAQNSTITNNLPIVFQSYSSLNGNKLLAPNVGIVVVDIVRIKLLLL